MATTGGGTDPTMMRNSLKNIKGFTLVETLISIAIIVIIGFAISSFERDIFFLNNSLQTNLSAQIDARRVLRTIIRELRSASPSSLGSYTINQAGTSTLVFYTNVDTDTLKERVRYFLEGDELRRGVIKPTGSPLTYNSANESVEVLVHDVVNSSTTPIFDYFDSYFTGTSSPLIQPVDTLSVRLVRVTVIIDKDSNRPPGAITVTSMGTLRNLKDNL